MQANHHERMSSVDTAWLRMDGPGHAMMIVGVAITAAPVAPRAFRRMLAERLLCYPRFRHKAVADPFGASWIEDEDFDLDRHCEVVALPEPAGQAGLERLVAELASKPLDPRHPRWQMHLIERYGAGSAWIIRVHHCYADGIAMIRVLLSMTEQDPAPALAAGQRGRRANRPPASGAEPVRTGWADRVMQPAGDLLEQVVVEGMRLLEGGVHQAFHPDRTASLLRRTGNALGEFTRLVTLPDDPPTPLRGPLSGQKVAAWGLPIPLDEVRTIARALGCTVNDVLMATVAGALGSYLRGQGVDTKGLMLRAMVPVNLRSADDASALGNRFGLVYVDLPVGIANPVERLLQARDALREIKRSEQPPLSLAVLSLLGMAPAGLQAPAIELFSRKSSAVVSNVPGPQSPLQVCGRPITEMYFWVPQSGSVGVGISLLSYAGRACFGIIADRARVPEPRLLAERIGREFENLLLAVIVGMLASRPPAAST